MNADIFFAGLLATALMASFFNLLYLPTNVIAKVSFLALIGVHLRLSADN